MEDDETTRDEWVCTGEKVTLGSMAVVCSKCGAISRRRSHFPKGKFSSECPQCRRKEAQRKAQAAWRARAAAKDEERVEGVARGRENIRLRMARRQRKCFLAMEALLDTQKVRMLTQRQTQALHRWTDKTMRMDHARQLLEKHLMTNNARALQFYLDFADDLVPVDADTEQLRREMDDARREDQDGYKGATEIVWE